ncbi:type III PLP-dependent enzyme [Mesorhizobium sp. BAC0120]|uniref:type III PLP-dependent enzyme n=1 Tax=Mesorhizobium sp. BAC0120 TaxID=3090670 RepID=UPI00298C5D3A|nr:type III PLP-dependent enzyme [Mesorhizobium sp. BAC0120]MDW6022341.1 type III PLP-dependent enzyme [Mesorhizobium sp. BAC0120]
MNSALAAAGAPTPAQLFDRVKEALPSLERARQKGRELDNFPSVDAVVQELEPSEPVFCIHPSELRAAARRFRAFPGRVLYAVKCNPHPAVLETLFDEGITDFDVASLDEIKLIHGLFGGKAGQYFNNPAKTRPAIRIASQEHQIRFYTVDCEGEIDKILEEAERDSDLVIAVRLATQSGDARYALSTKFGAAPADAVRLLQKIGQAGVRAGISFHVGSQCLSPSAFEKAIELMGSVARKARVPLHVLNVGGGFPAPYPGDDPKTIEHYFSRIVIGRRKLDLPSGCLLLCEPGRSLVATAGTAVLQVVVRRGDCVFLNDGVFGTLQELGHPKERRPTRVIRKVGSLSARLAQFKVYGPTCDSNDVLGAPFLLPADVREGDWIEVGMMGAYSLSMRTRFNGFHADKIVAVTN